MSSSDTVHVLRNDSEPPEEETQLHRWAVAERAAPRPHPRVEWTDSAGDHSLVLTERALVGSAQKAGVVVTDATVSRIHAELEEVDGHLWVRDLGSRNGTYVEGIQVQSARIPDGGRVRVGATDLRVRYDVLVATPAPWPEARFGPLVGRSEVMRNLFAQLARVAATDSSALIRGETGTGKELVARAIHEASARAMKPLVILDCGSIPEHLLEAELFGHARGAFTGATSDRVGAFEAAEGGTIFLDEVGELPLQMQPKLLRVIESRCIRRLGETAQRPVNVRIISATHRDLRTMVNAGAFREDLYFRLAVLPIDVPALRDRKDDIGLLVEHLLPTSSARLPPELVEDLATRPWLGNVRELRNFVERALAFGAKEALAMSDDLVRRTTLPMKPPKAEEETTSILEAAEFEGHYRSFREAWLDRGEREYVRRLLERHSGVVAAAAKAAGLDRTYFYKLLRRHGIVPGPSR
jgi:transcriptional regulator with GAF, ATPase, and Fis domain